MNNIRDANVVERLTFSSSGSQESNVSDRTLEQWTPKLLAGEKTERNVLMEQQSALYGGRQGQHANTEVMQNL